MADAEERPGPAPRNRRRQRRESAPKRVPQTFLARIAAITVRTFMREWAPLSRVHRTAPLRANVPDGIMAWTTPLLPENTCTGLNGRVCVGIPAENREPASLHGMQRSRVEKEEGAPGCARCVAAANPAEDPRPTEPPEIVTEAVMCICCLCGHVVLDKGHVTNSSKVLSPACGEPVFVSHMSCETWLIRHAFPTVPAQGVYAWDDVNIPAMAAACIARKPQFAAERITGVLTSEEFFSQSRRVNIDESSLVRYGLVRQIPVAGEPGTFDVVARDADLLANTSVVLMAARTNSRETATRELFCEDDVAYLSLKQSTLVEDADGGPNALIPTPPRQHANEDEENDAGRASVLICPDYYFKAGSAASSVFAPPRMLSAYDLPSFAHLLYETNLLLDATADIGTTITWFFRGVRDVGSNAASIIAMILLLADADRVTLCFKDCCAANRHTPLRRPPEPMSVNAATLLRVLTLQKPPGALTERFCTVSAWFLYGRPIGGMGKYVPPFAELNYDSDDEARVFRDDAFLSESRDVKLLNGGGQPILLGAGGEKRRPCARIQLERVRRHYADKFYVLRVARRLRL